MGCVRLFFGRLWQKNVGNNCKNPMSCYRYVHYVQGQSPEPRIREYFYFIDHQGQLFLDDCRMKNFTSCFKEKKFLAFFFTRLKINYMDRYTEFPYLSPCGRERNFIRCDDRPIVYTSIIPSDDSNTPDRLSYGGAGELLTIPFEPHKVCMLTHSGRIYYPAQPKQGDVGLIKSNMAIELSKYFDFENGEMNPPTHFTWKGVRHTLSNELLPLMENG
ncbi:UPF0598 protein CG30010-like [Gigantopelta aegis]|uniref:UPF0598 protein CG30010-like n=1 Tax=Gigantopelta aegis TaxID=1735272 RepID=UPI001B88CE5C|nr:UPF0598 protein CG30010-like [Gigantopelta aegis]